MKGTEELLSIITKRMSEKGIELNHVDLYEQAVGINNKVKVCLASEYFLVCNVDSGDGVIYHSSDSMLNKVLYLLTENKWLPGDDIESYGEWFTLVVEEDNHYTILSNEYCSYRLLDNNYKLSNQMTLEDLKMNYINVSLEDRLK